MTIKTAFDTMSKNVEKIVDHFRVSPLDVRVDWEEQVLYLEVNADFLNDVNYGSEDFKHLCDNGLTDMNGTMVFQSGKVVFSFTPKETEEDVCAASKPLVLNLAESRSLESYLLRRKVGSLIWAVKSLRNRTPFLTLNAAKDCCDEYLLKLQKEQDQEPNQ